MKNMPVIFYQLQWPHHKQGKRGSGSSLVAYVCVASSRHGGDAMQVCHTCSNALRRAVLPTSRPSKPCALVALSLEGEWRTPGGRDGRGHSNSASVCLPDIWLRFCWHVVSWKRRYSTMGHAGTPTSTGPTRATTYSGQEPPVRTPDKFKMEACVAWELGTDGSGAAPGARNSPDFCPALCPS